MIILRQKIFYDYSGLTPEEAAKVREQRNLIAKKLLAQRKVALQRQKTNIDFSNKRTNEELSKLESLGFDNKNKEQIRQGIIANNQNIVNKSYQVRNSEYDRMLANAKQEASAIDSKYKRTLPRSNNYGTEKVDNVYRPQQALPQSQTQKHGIGTVGKVAIGAGIAAAGYGAYRLLKNRKSRKEAEEELERERNRR